ncbi:alpha/beta fold hydrolase [Nocardia sp. ET3-3]|uniref:Alpha/beta fold hydrolase n=1 Tax=Nocardia terrae TaxID=2675851 RepID=A0A7K1US45_9NOCA|nr:alpha/beta fold hydrolase [Nocardia terrae]MVU77173.1 alpha/beta fold hydrolase [Nocardia terrae]
MERDALIAAHEAAGRYVDVGGVRTFVREEGTGEVPVVCVHGVPVSSYLWRRVLPALADRGLRGIAPDLPGLGLSDRPTDFDYSWTGLGRHLGNTLDALGIERCHLVVHDIGGPVGFEAAAQRPERVASLTVLDTMVEAHTFVKPWPMRPYGIPVLDRLWLAGSKQQPIFRLVMRRVGLAPHTTVSGPEMDVHRTLLTRGDEGEAFLRIMHSFQTTRAKTALYTAVVADRRYPVQVLWAADDPAIPLQHHGRYAARVAHLDAPVVLPGRHFFPEDSATQIADHIRDLAARAHSATETETT